MRRREAIRLGGVMSAIFCHGEIVGGVRVNCDPPLVFTIPRSVELAFDDLADSWEAGAGGVRFGSVTFYRAECGLGCTCAAVFEVI